jgi:hypothetical protein
VTVSFGEACRSLYSSVSVTGRRASIVTFENSCRDNSERKGGVSSSADVNQPHFPKTQTIHTYKLSHCEINPELEKQQQQRHGEERGWRERVRWKRM